VIPPDTLAPSPEWTELAPGTDLSIVKLAPDGHEVTRYSGQVIAPTGPDFWLGARAVWTFREVLVGNLQFVPGDTLDEYFSGREWFNAFQVIAPSGESRGWYANVTYPSRIETGAAGPTLYWHDLYVDVVIANDGTIAVLDEDELTESGMATQNPELHKKILDTRDLILRRITDRNFPFDQ
jgi:hypothetical protein